MWRFLVVSRCLAGIATLGIATLVLMAAGVETPTATHAFSSFVVPPRLVAGGGFRFRGIGARTQRW